MNIDDMSFDDFDIDFDAPNPSAKPHHSASEFADWLRSRGTYSTLVKKRMVKAIATLTTAMGITKQCPCCKGTGVFHGATYTRDCIRCKGKGHMDEADIRRHEAYTLAKRTNSLRTKAENYGNNWFCHA